MHPPAPTPLPGSACDCDNPEVDQDDNRVCIEVVCDLDEIGSFYSDF